MPTDNQTSTETQTSVQQPSSNTSSTCPFDISSLIPSRKVLAYTGLTTAIGCAIYYYYSRD